jgi:hypothetical protein
MGCSGGIGAAILPESTLVLSARMPLDDYFVGVLFFAAIWGAAGLVAWTLVRRRLPQLTGAPAVLAFGVLFLGALILFHLIPGALGLLSRVSVLVTAALAALLCLRVPRRPPPAEPSGPPPAAAPSGRWSTVIATVAVAVVAANVLAAFRHYAPLSPSQIDSLSFGLPGVAHWIRAESVWDTGAFLRLFPVRTYPNNGDVVMLATILPWRNDAFLRFAALPLLGMIGLGVYALARELRAPASLAALVAALALSVQALTLPAIDQLKPDVFMQATFVAGCAFLLRSVRTGDRSDLVLAGLGLGLAFGSRWYGVTEVAAVMALWGVALLVARRPRPPLFRDAAILAAVVLVSGGFWFVRNLALTGDPLYPVKIAPFGVTIFDAPRDIVVEKLGYSILDRLDQPGVVRHYILPDYSHVLGLPGLVLLVGTLLVFPLAFARRRAGGRLPWVALCVALAALLIALVYSATPVSAQGLKDRPLPGIIGANARWLVPALLVASGATAWSLMRLGRARIFGEALVALAVIAGVHQTYGAPARDFVLAAALLAAASAAGVWVARHREGLPRHRFGLATAAAAALVGLVALGQLSQHRYNDRRFAGATPVVDWIRGEAPSGHRVAVAGGWPSTAFVPTYALFGPRLGNHVAYLGPIRRAQVLKYRSSSSFLSALERGRYDLLLVGRLEDPDLDNPRRTRLLPDPPEARWARRAGFRQVAEDGSFVLLASASTAPEATMNIAFPRRNSRASG